MKYFRPSPIFFIILLVFSLSLPLLTTSCRPAVKEQLITVSIAPERYFVERIAGDKYEVKELVPEGVGAEEYDPTPANIAALSRSSLYFYMGSLGFEKVWLKTIKENNTKLKSVDISTYLVNKGEGKEKISHHHGEEDPHYWTSIMGAVAISKGIYEALIAQYPSDSQTFAQNYDLLLKDINKLEQRCREVFTHTKHKGFVIYHPSLTYFAQEWGLKQLAIEEDGKEPSPRHIQQLIERAGEDSIGIVFVQKEFDRSRAEEIAQKLDAKIYEIAPLSYDWQKEMQRIIEAFAE